MRSAPGCALEKTEGCGARLAAVRAAQELEIGRHLDAQSRVEFAAELRKRLRILIRGMKTNEGNENHSQRWPGSRA